MGCNQRIDLNFAPIHLPNFLIKFVALKCLLTVDPLHFNVGPISKEVTQEFSKRQTLYFVVRTDFKATARVSSSLVDTFKSTHSLLQMHSEFDVQLPRFSLYF